MSSKVISLKIIAGLLGFLSVMNSAADDSCAVANFNTTITNVDIPCVIAGTERLSMQLMSVPASEVCATQ